jgi:hypothetical protein
MQTKSRVAQFVHCCDVSFKASAEQLALVSSARGLSHFSHRFILTAYFRFVITQSRPAKNVSSELLSSQSSGTLQEDRIEFLSVQENTSAIRQESSFTHWTLLSLKLF